MNDKILIEIYKGYQNGSTVSEGWTTNDDETIGIRAMTIRMERGESLICKGRYINGTSVYRTHLSIVRNSK